MMDEGKKASFTQMIGNMFSIVHKIVSDIFHLASAEAALAKQSLANIVLLSFVFGALFTSTWLCVMALIVACLTTWLQLSMITALLLVTIFNIAMIALAAVVFIKLKGNLFFRATRNQISSTKKLFKDSYRERITAKN